MLGYLLFWRRVVLTLVAVVITLIAVMALWQ